MTDQTSFDTLTSLVHLSDQGSLQPGPGLSETFNRLGRPAWELGAAVLNGCNDYFEAYATQHGQEMGEKTQRRTYTRAANNAAMSAGLRAQDTDQYYVGLGMENKVGSKA